MPAQFLQKIRKCIGFATLQTLKTFNDSTHSRHFSDCVLQKHIAADAKTPKERDFLGGSHITLSINYELTFIAYQILI